MPANGDVVPVTWAPDGRTTGELGELFDGEPELNGECDAVLLALRSAYEPLGAPPEDAMLELAGSRALTDLLVCVCARVCVPEAASNAAVCVLLESTGENDVGECTPLPHPVLDEVELRVTAIGWCTASDDKDDKAGVGEVGSRRVDARNELLGDMPVAEASLELGRDVDLCSCCVAVVRRNRELCCVSAFLRSSRSDPPDAPLGPL